MPYQKQQNLVNSPTNADSDNNKDLLPYPPNADSENTEDLLPFPSPPWGRGLG